jgi:hypothetical protein
MIGHTLTRTHARPNPYPCYSLHDVTYALPNINQCSPPEIAMEDSNNISTAVCTDAEETAVLNGLVELRSEAGDG